MTLVNQLWPLTLTWAALVALLVVIHKVLHPQSVPTTESIKGRIFAAEMVVLSLLWGAFVIIELDAVRRGDRPEPFYESALELLGAFVVSLGVYRYFSKGQ